MADFLIDLALHAARTTFDQLAYALGPVALLALALHVLGSYSERVVRRQFGDRFFLAVFAGAGTILHELAHVVAALLSGHTIRDVIWFRPDPRTGRRGRVVHAYNPQKVSHQLGRVLVSIAPILAGALAVAFFADRVVGLEVFGAVQQAAATAPAGPDGRIAVPTASYAAVWAALAESFERSPLSDPRAYALLYLAVSVGSSMHLSRADRRGLTGGLLLIGWTLVVVNGGAALLARPWVATFEAWVLATAAGLATVLLFCVLAHLAGLLAVLLVGRVVRWVRSRVGPAG